MVRINGIVNNPATRKNTPATLKLKTMGTEGMNSRGRSVKKKGDMNMLTENAPFTTDNAAVLSASPVEFAVNSRHNEINTPIPNPVHKRPNKTIKLLEEKTVRKNPNAHTKKPEGTIHFFSLWFNHENARPVMVDPSVETESPNAVTYSAISGFVAIRNGISVMMMKKKRMTIKLATDNQITNFEMGTFGSLLLLVADFGEGGINTIAPKKMIGVMA